MLFRIFINLSSYSEEIAICKTRNISYDRYTTLITTDILFMFEII